MKKKCLFPIFIGLLVSQLSFSQTRIASFNNTLKTNSSLIKDAIPVVNKETGELIMFIADAKSVYAYKLNNEFKLKDQLSSETKKRKYKVLLGNSVNGNNYRLFLSNKKKKKFASINFSFDTKKTTTNEFELLKDESFIQTISHNNDFYLFTGSKITGRLYLYSFNKGIPKRNEVKLNGNFLFNKFNTPTKITAFLLRREINNNNILSNKTKPLNKFEKDTPNAIETVADREKMYLKGNDIILTFDEHPEITQIVTINIKTKELTKKFFNKPLIDIKSIRKKSNSFLYDNYIALVAATKKIFSMHILDYNSGKIVKEYTINRDEAIAFKNSPIIQEGGVYDNYRELEKTKKFLRKITAGKLGVSIIKNKDGYNFTIGGYVKQQVRSGSGAMMAGFGAMGAIPVANFSNTTIFSNPTMFAYYSFTKTKSTRIECVFDKDFNHIKEAETPANVFDKIKESKTRNQEAKTVFRYKNFFIKGDYNSSIKEYYLTKFE